MRRNGRSERLPRGLMNDVEMRRPDCGRYISDTPKIALKRPTRFFWPGKSELFRRSGTIKWL